MPRFGGIDEWLSSNAGRAFPLREDADLSVIGGTLPNGLLLDFRAVVVPSVWNGSQDVSVKLRSISVSDSQDGMKSVRASFSLYTGGVSMAVPNAITAWLSAEVAPGGWSRRRARSVSARSGMAPEVVDVSVVLGCPVGVENGEYTLSTPQEISTDRILYIPGGIGIDTLKIGSTEVHGRIHVHDGMNTTLSVLGGELVLDVGYGIGKGYACPPGLEDACDFIRYVNGQRAAGDGDFSIVGGEGVSVSSGEWNGMPAVVVTTNSTVNEFAKPRSSNGS